MRLEPGSQLDRYTIEAIIGEGGMGRVCRAFDTRLHRRVALKVLHIADAADAADAVIVPATVRAVAAMARSSKSASYELLGHPRSCPWRRRRSRHQSFREMPKGVEPDSQCNRAAVDVLVRSIQGWRVTQQVAQSVDQRVGIAGRHDPLAP